MSLTSPASISASGVSLSTDLSCRSRVEVAEKARDLKPDALFLFVPILMRLRGRGAVLSQVAGDAD